MANDTFDVIIGGQVITLPLTNSSPNWAPGLVQFCQAVADVLANVAGTFDVAPQIYNMVANANSNVAIPNLAFSPAVVRSALVNYSIFRLTNTSNEAETGTLELLYNSEAPTTEKWTMTRTSTGSSTVDFLITDDGQISFTSVALSGSNYSGNIVFKASTLQQDYT